MVIVAIKQTLLFNSSGVYFRAISVRQYSFGHRMGSECAQEAEIQVFGHKNGAICAREHSFGHKISSKRAQAAETLVFGHKNGSKRAQNVLKTCLNCHSQGRPSPSILIHSLHQASTILI